MLDAGRPRPSRPRATQCPRGANKMPVTVTREPHLMSLLFKIPEEHDLESQTRKEREWRFLRNTRVRQQARQLIQKGKPPDSRGRAPPRARGRAGGVQALLQAGPLDPPRALGRPLPREAPSSLSHERALCALPVPERKEQAPRAPSSAWGTRQTQGPACARLAPSCDHTVSQGCI